jgi:hypothetical protein
MRDLGFLQRRILFFSGKTASYPRIKNNEILRKFPPTAASLNKLHNWGKCRPLLTILRGVNTLPAAAGGTYQQPET